jgi:hypothetical protein
MILIAKAPLKKDIKEKKSSKSFITVGWSKLTKIIKFKENWYKKYKIQGFIKFNRLKNLHIQTHRPKTKRSSFHYNKKYINKKWVVLQ